MKITFIGVGEAVNTVPNTSILVEDSQTLLLDCGYSVPLALWNHSTDPNFIDAISISHLHADHYFGLPAIILRMMFENRTKALTIFAPKEFSQLIPQLLDMAYGDVYEQAKFKINLEPIEEHDIVTMGDMSLTFAKTKHPRGNLAVKITNGVHTVCYSGDGKMTDASKRLYKHCDLLIHESHQEKNVISITSAYHESIETLQEYQRTHHIKQIACVHLSRNLDKSNLEQYQNDNFRFPAPGDSIEL